jgi:hypothetical protein
MSALWIVATIAICVGAIVHQEQTRPTRRGHSGSGLAEQSGRSADR